MSKEKRRVPKLRFPGFTEDWEQHKLSEVVTINPKTELPDEFKYVDLESVVGTNLLGFQVVKKENAPSRAQRLASYGDVFYQTVRPYQRNNYLFENVDKNMVFSTGYAQLRSKLDSYFLLTLVQNDNFVKVVLDNCTGTSYPAINGSALGKITVRIPSNEVEANQIGKVFRGIDKNITLHQRKLEHLNLKKKALLQKLFPKNGARYPELRFPGFTDAWEQRELSSLTEYIGTGKSRFVINEFGEYAILGSTNVIGYDDTYDYDGNFILTARVGANAGQLYRYSGKVKITDNTVFIMSDSSQFIYYTLTYFDLRRLSFGTGQPLVKSSELQKLKLCVPVSKSEQEKIGEIFNNIDNIITLHQRKLEHLQLQKKALLQQMFV
ncbi:MAG: restriction endonuclease subunit S [Veillonella sp.]|uniref:restriction endonuclease subunit S n=1 Tax=Veillonella sp. TaxID=1926307 RepID=UPI00290BA700|nr:restriction endonuclease subunit S [Veillonella sp.]MDU6572021.1 restriction endonuclease subunit S [Veillonella sp.]